MQRWLARPRQAGARAARRRHDDDDGRHGARDADARHAHRRADDSSSTQAQGPEFDRLFLTFMIQHHRGAVSMVKDLFGTYGAAQDEIVFKFASDVNVDQTTEIARMEKMLAALPPARSHARRDRRKGTRPWPPIAQLPKLSLAARRSLAVRRCAHSTLLVRRRGVAGAGHVHHGAEPRSARRPPRRRDGCRRGGVEPAACSRRRRRPRSSSASTNSDLAFTGNYAIQGNYNGYQVWDISNPAKPGAEDGVRLPGVAERRVGLQEPAVRLGRGLTGRLDCGTEGVKDTVSKERLRGLRIFDISDIAHPKNVGNVQTCRGSHTHTRAGRSQGHGQRLRLHLGLVAACARRTSCRAASSATPDQDPNSALFRIEVIKVPLAHPEQAAIVSSPRIFNDLAAPARARRDAGGHRGRAKQAADGAGRGRVHRRRSTGRRSCCRREFVEPLLDSVVKARGGTGAPTAADSAALREALPAIIDEMVGTTPERDRAAGPTQCHDITRLSGDRPGRRRVRRLRAAARHQRSGASRSASAPCPTRTSPTGTRRRSTTTAPRCCSPTSGAAAASRSAAPPTSASGARTRSSRSSTGRCSSRATTSCRRRRRRRRTASRTTAR